MDSLVPTRRSAGSMASGRFVAPMTITWPRLSSPSMSARSVDTMLAWIWSYIEDDRKYGEEQ